MIRKTALISLTAFLSLLLVAMPVVSQTVVPRPVPPIAGFTFAYATGATNQVKITITALSATRAAIPYAAFDFWLSDNPTGGTVTTTAANASGTGAALTIIGGVGQYVGTTTVPISTAGTITSFLTGGTGTVVLGVLDSGKTLWYPVAFSRQTGARAVGTKLTAANYAWMWTERHDLFGALAEVFIPRSKERGIL